MTRWYGISKDNAGAVFESFDPSKFMVYFIDEGDPEKRTPESLNRRAVQLRDAFKDDRTIAGVVQGGPSWLAACRKGLSEDVFAVVVLVGTVPVLKRIGVEVLDEKWKPGDKRILFDDVMATASVDRGDRVRAIHDGKPGLVESLLLGGRFAQVRFAGREAALVVPLWAVRRIER